ncbi:hypothetical protein Forpe1208_v005706 [Fusarium oxysporum f. sp. rapae]|uniref:Uncharacterized protein n=1 Tax=Fusarium oxysporum f. sp. rapae TaxID=485398 RepID=A0A8J5TYV8_FUSOX|nr:hypothetical protein Forpe1208_v005706 [Fusarium oxysporum f. sp. rapae]
MQNLPAVVVGQPFPNLWSENEEGLPVRWFPVLFSPPAWVSLVLMGRVAAITQVLDEGLSDADLLFNLDPDGVKLVKRDKTFAEPIAAFKNWMEYEASMFYIYQWYMLAPYFVLADDDEPRVTHRAMSYMIPLPFSVTETVPDSVMSPMCGYLGMQKITIHHAHHSQRDPKVSNLGIEC